ncbi:MAG: 4Fe-4S binding protein [Dehalococcoidia bacterium]|nr:MAG: 4Fe-4S binding protein [Dehalococcoidia bacterium]
MNKLRWSTQLLTLFVVNLGFTPALKLGVVCPVFYCYGCPWATFACPIGVFQTYGALHAFPFYAVGLLGIFALLLGRFWCGWACPFGTVQDLVVWIRRRKDFVELPRFPWTGFIVLVGAIIAAWIALDTLFCKVCSAGSLFAAIPQWFASRDELSFGTFFYVHLGTLAVALIMFILVGRFWCRYLCPLGIGIFGIFNRVSFLKIKPDMDKCNNCGECLEICPVKIAEPEEIENSIDCIRCGKCIDRCPTEAIKITASARR